MNIVLTLSFSDCINADKGSLSLDKSTFKLTLYNSAQQQFCQPPLDEQLLVNMRIDQEAFETYFTYNSDPMASNVVLITCQHARFEDCANQIKKYKSGQLCRVSVSTTGTSQQTFYDSYLKLKVVALSSGEVVGITVGCAIGLIALIIGIWWLVIYSKKKLAYKKFQKLDSEMEY